MRRTILSVAYPLAGGVGAGSVGGAEQVMAMHSAGLVRAGHRSIVIAPAGSSVIGELVPIPKWEGPFDAATVGHAHRAVIERIADVLAREPVDLVHMHGHDFDRYLPTPGVPTLITLHLPPSWYSRDALAPLRRATHFACVSRSQRASLPCWGPNAVVAPNGVDVGSYAPAREKGDYLLVLTRISPEKGIDEALAAATAAGVRLLVAGEVSAWPEHRRYFENHIVPRLGTEHAFLGPIVGERKRSLLARARAVLIPSRAPEASSLVAMEALASGTPVIAYGIGALPDLIDDGKTGFLVDGPASMTRAIAAVGSIDPTACRVEAQARFSASAMTTRYLELYERMLDAERAIATVGATPLAIEEVHGVDALAELAAEWAVLVARSPTATPFQRPEWLLEYARVFASTADVWALVARREGRLVGLAPLLTRGAETTLLGAGVSDYLDVIVDPGAPLVTAEALVDALLARLGSGGRAVLDELRPGSALRACRASRRGARCIEIEAPRAPCPVLPLPRGLDPLRGLRTRLRQAARRAARVGPLRFERASSREALEAWLTALITLHQARWAARGGGVLAPADVQRFLRRAVPALASVGVASIHGLSIGPRRAAAMLVLEDACAAYYYIGGFDPDLASLSPGTLLLTHAIDAAVAAGRLEFDFLRGAEAYKYRFGAVDRTNVRRILSPVRELPAIVAAPSRRSAAYAALFPR